MTDHLDVTSIPPARISVSLHTADTPEDEIFRWQVAFGHSHSAAPFTPEKWSFATTAAAQTTHEHVMQTGVHALSTSEEGTTSAGSASTDHPGMLTGFVTSARANPGVSVPLIAAAMVAVIGFTLTVQEAFAVIYRAQDLGVPTSFVPDRQRVSSQARGLLIVAFLAALLLVICYVYGYERERTAKRTRWPSSFIVRVQRRVSGGYRLVALVAGLLAAAALAGLALVVAAASFEFYAGDKSLENVWVVRKTSGTADPVLVLHGDSGQRILRPLTRVEGGFAPCGAVTQPARGIEHELVLVESLGKLVDASRCP